MKHKFLILSCCLFCLACTKESKVQEVQETVMHISTEDIILCDDNTLELGISLMDAQKKGISQSEYDQVARLLEDQNLHIQESISSLITTKSSENPGVRAYGYLVYDYSTPNDEALSAYVSITETDFAIDCNFQSSTPWITHYFRVYGSVNQEISFQTGELSDSRYYGFEGHGPGIIQMGYHTNDYNPGICVWSVIF